MVHDLTQNGDFRVQDNFRGILRDINTHINNSIEERVQYEVVLTGSGFERDIKRFHVDYETEQNLCDCCGRTLDKIPWSFERTLKKLCKKCDDWLEKNYGGIESGPLLENTSLIIGESNNGFIVSKPWTMLEEIPTRNFTDNIFLWD